MRAISEEKKNFRKKIITILGLIVSLVGAIITLLLGIEAFNREFWGGGTMYLILIIPMGLAIFGDLVGFYRKAVGISISIAIGFIGVICVFILTPFYFTIPILLILIGGMVGLIANYDNLKAWKEQNFPSKHKKEAGWKIKEILPGVIFLILGGILIFISFFYLLFNGFSFFFLTNVMIIFFPGMIFMIIGPVLIKKGKVL